MEAGKVELDGASYFGLSLPFSISQLVWIEALALGGAEVYRNSELDLEKRLYPGGFFDPLKLATGDEDRAFRLKTAEIKHARLAMLAFLGRLLVPLAWPNLSRARGYERPPLLAAVEVPLVPSTCVSGYQQHP